MSHVCYNVFYVFEWFLLVLITALSLKVHNSKECVIDRCWKTVTDFVIRLFYFTELVAIVCIVY